MEAIYNAVSPILASAGWTKLEITSWINYAFENERDNNPTDDTLEEWKSDAIATAEQTADEERENQEYYRELAESEEY